MMGDVWPQVRLTVVQAAPVFLDREATVDKACRLIRAAAAEGAQLIAFPEGFVPAHPIWYHFHPATSTVAMRFARELFKNAVEIPSPATDALSQAAADAGAFVVIGVCEREPGTTGTLYNTLLFIQSDGTLAGRHRKLVPTVGERLVHSPGDAKGLRAFASPFGPVSGLMCGENSNPLACFAVIGSSTVFHVASWPQHFGRRDDVRMQEIIGFTSRSLAYQAKAFVLSAVGEVSEEMMELLPASDEDRAFLERQGGGSCIVGPRGDVLAGPLPPGEGTAHADVSVEAVLAPKVNMDFAGHYNRFDLFDFRVDGRVPEVVGTRLGLRRLPSAEGSDAR